MMPIALITMPGVQKLEEKTVRRELEGNICRGGGIDGFDFGEGMGRADEYDNRLPGAVDVVGIIAGSGQETLVFLAADRDADAVFSHDSVPVKSL